MAAQRRPCSDRGQLRQAPVNLILIALPRGGSHHRATVIDGSTACDTRPRKTCAAPVRAKHRKLDDPSTAGGKQSSSIVQAISKGQLTTPTSQITAQHAEEVLPERFT